MADATTAETPDWRRRLSSVSVSLGLMAGGFLLYYLVGSLYLSLLVALSLGDEWAVRYPGAVILQGLVFGAVVGGYVVWTDSTDLVKARLPSLRGIGLTVLGVGALVGTLAVVSVVFSELGISPAVNQVERIGRENPTVLLLMIPLAFLVIGPGEELLFRGAIQGLLRRAYAPVPAVAIASGLFGVAHVASLGGSTEATLAYVVVVFLLGSILGGLYELTDNLVVPSLVHGAYDALVFGSIYASATGLL